MVVELPGGPIAVNVRLATVALPVMGVVVIKPLMLAESPEPLTNIVKPGGPEPAVMLSKPSRIPPGLQLILIVKAPISGAEIEIEALPLPPESSWLVALTEAD
jgi:hypothetical protein